MQMARNPRPQASPTTARRFATTDSSVLRFGGTLTLCEGMKRHTTATILCSAMSALLLLATFASSGRTAGPRPVADTQQHERAVPGAALQHHESRLPFVAATAPTLELTRATQLRVPSRLGTRTESSPRTQAVHTQFVARNAARSVVTVAGFIHYAALLNHIRQGLPTTHNTPPPVAVS